MAGVVRMGLRAAAVVAMLALSDTGAAVTVDRVLATVNNEVITLTDYRRFVGKSEPGAGVDGVEERLLRRLIEETIILQEAKKAGISAGEEEVRQGMRNLMREHDLTEEELRSRLAEEGLTIEEYRDMLKDTLTSLIFIDREVNTKVMVGDEEIAEYYEKNKGLFVKSRERLLVKAIHLKFTDAPSVTEITDLKLKSLQIREAIDDGESFEKMVGLHSSSPLRERDGVLGDLERGTLIPALEAAISSIKEGEVGGPVWTKEGVYILKLVRRTPEAYDLLNEAKSRIRVTLHERKRERKYNDWVQSLWERSSVSIKKPL